MPSDPSLIKYDPAIIGPLADNVGRGKSQTAELKSDVQSHSATLSAHWISSTASGNWTDAQTRWNNACERLTTALGQLQQKTVSAMEDMSSTEGRNAAMF
jgi:WXG100 family type VII secretion target